VRQRVKTCAWCLDPHHPPLVVTLFQLWCVIVGIVLHCVKAAVAVAAMATKFDSKYVMTPLV